DIQIGLLDSDVPSSITYYKVLPPDFAQKLWAFTDIPIIGFDQEEKALTGICNSTESVPSLKEFSIAAPQENLRLSFYVERDFGDSGNPVFFIINNNLTLLFTQLSSSSGPFITAFIDEVNDLMLELGGGYTLTFIDISLFPLRTQ
ncbi:MAG: hypothetical protein ACFBZ8_02355, partial [Opitutales bacterium]